MKIWKAKATEEKAATASLVSENVQVLLLLDENQNLLENQKENPEKNTQNELSTTIRIQDPAIDNDQAQNGLPAESVTAQTGQESRNNYSRKLHLKNTRAQANLEQQKNSQNHRHLKHVTTAELERDEENTSRTDGTEKKTDQKRTAVNTLLKKQMTVASETLLPLVSPQKEQISFQMKTTKKTKTRESKTN